MSLTFLSPLGALVGLLALLPIAAALLRERRFERVRAALRLPAPARPIERSFAAAAVALFGLLALGAAQPVARLDEAVSARTDAEAFVVLDASRSMLASGAPDGATRFARAVAFARALRRELPDVPTGLASMTDRPLPHLFPTVDAEAFASVVERAVGVDRPPPADGGHARATDFGALTAFARENYFSPGSVRRLVVLLTDGESRPFDVRSVADRLLRGGVGLVVVRFWDARERVYRPDGTAEPGYVPDASSRPALDRLAALTAGGRVLAEQDGAGALEAARAYLGSGPSVRAVERRRAVPLAAYAVLAACVPLAFLLVRRAGAPAPGRAGS